MELMKADKARFFPSSGAARVSLNQLKGPWEDNLNFNCLKHSFPRRQRLDLLTIKQYHRSEGSKDAVRAAHYSRSLVSGPR